MRVVVDCRMVPSESRCSLTIAGEEDEVLRAGVAHAVDVHGHVDGDELRSGLRAAMRPEAGERVTGFGTVMIGRLAAGRSLQDLSQSLQRWEQARRVPGFIGAQVLTAADGSVVNTAVFSDAESYARLADDPKQDAWYRAEIAPLLDGEPRWIDGEWALHFRRPQVTLPEQTAPSTSVTATP